MKIPNVSGDEDSGSTDDQLVLRPLLASDTPALAELFRSCYKETYHADIYKPDVIAAQITSGRRIGAVAENTAGELVAHWGAMFISSLLVESCGAVTDRRYQRRGLAAALSASLLPRLQASDVAGSYGEPVVTHTATQDMVLGQGYSFTGLRIHCFPPFEQVGFTDGIQKDRVTLVVAFLALKPLLAADVWVPAEYAEFLEIILRKNSWNRTMRVDAKRWSAPPRTLCVVQHLPDLGRSSIAVETVGDDLIAVVALALTAARDAGSVNVELKLPTAQPALAAIGGGLLALGFSFAAFVPILREDSDVLILQWLPCNPIDTAKWAHRSEDLRELGLAILHQLRNFN